MIDKICYKCNNLLSKRYTKTQNLSSFCKECIINFDESDDVDFLTGDIVGTWTKYVTNYVFIIYEFYNLEYKIAIYSNKSHKYIYENMINSFPLYIFNKNIQETIDNLIILK